MTRIISPVEVEFIAFFKGNHYAYGSSSNHTAKEADMPRPLIAFYLIAAMAVVVILAAATIPWFGKPVSTSPYSGLYTVFCGAYLLFMLTAGFITDRRKFSGPMDGKPEEKPRIVIGLVGLVLSAVLFAVTAHPLLQLFALIVGAASLITAAIPVVSSAADALSRKLEKF